MLKKLLSTVAICALAASPSFAQDKPWPGSGGSSGGAVSVTSASPNIVINPTPGTGTFTIGATVVLNAQVGTSYTVVASDCGKLVSFNNASPIAVTLPQAIGSFAAGCAISFQDRGAGTAAITPTTSTINGSASLALTQNQGCDANSDGTNWQVSSCTAIVTSSTPVTTVAASGASQALAFPASGNAAYDVTQTANCTFTISGGVAGQLQRVTLILRQDGTAGRTPTLPAGIKWKGGIAPTPNTQAGKIDVFYITTPDGGTTLLGDY